MDLTLKPCSSCKEHQSLDQFPLSKFVKSGYDYKCKRCYRESWHKRKKMAADWYQMEGEFTPTKELLNELFLIDDNNNLRWRVEFAAKAKKGTLAGDNSKGRQRIFIKGVRYRADELIHIMGYGEKPTIKKIKEGWLKDYETEWIKEIKSAKKDFDWSSVWVKEKARINSYNQYHKLTTSERRAKELKTNRCPIKLANNKIKWKSDNADKVKEQNKLWRKNNPDKIREYGRRSERASRRNPKHRSKLNLRNRFKCLMRTAKKGGSISFSKTIGCTTKDLVAHLESKFKRGMTWDNYGSHWHVDHIMPCAAFNHLDPNQVKQCWHWTNLQPLEADKNLAKSDTITNPQLSLCI